MNICLALGYFFYKNVGFIKEKRLGSLGVDLMKKTLCSEGFLSIERNVKSDDIFH